MTEYSQFTDKSTIEWVENKSSQWLGNTSLNTSSDLSVSIQGFDETNLYANVHGWGQSELKSYISTHLPADLLAELNIIEIRDLLTSITGEWWHGSADLLSGISKIFQRSSSNLYSILHGWSEFFLQAHINSMRTSDLPTSIIAGLFNIPKNLGAFIASNPLGELQGLIHGFDTFHLQSNITGVYSPYDIQAYIYGVSSVNLSGIIRMFRGIQQPFNLSATVEAYGVLDLSAIIGLIHPVNLPAFIQAYGKTLDLNASIVPKTILIRRAVQVSLLEHSNLTALINYMCGGSDGKNLSAYVYVFMKKDLSARVTGWYSSTVDNLSNLNAYINVRDYVVSDTFRPINFTGLHTDKLYTKLPIHFTVKDSYTNINALPIYFTSPNRLNLGAYIKSILSSINLSASITPIFDYNYTDLPPWIIPKTHEVVLDIERMEEQWKRFVEIMFDNSGTSESGDTNFVYFYVNGTQKVYRMDRNRHWTVWVKSYITDAESMIERKLVRYKYTFNLSKYSTIDEAVRDLIDRVSSYRFNNLNASIYPNPILGDLGATIIVKSLRHWIKHLPGWIIGIASTQKDLNTQIFSELYKGSAEMPVTISSSDRIPPEGNNILFNFDNDNYVSPAYNDIQLIWTGEDAK